MQIARRTEGITIRRAPGLTWYHFTFNGADGSILADPGAAAGRSPRASTGRPSPRSPSAGWPTTPAPLNNHIYVAGQEGYQDNSGVVAFDPEKAKQELDALGWRINGQFREKDGRQLVIRDVLLRRVEHPAVRADRAEQPRPRSASSWTSTSRPAARLLHRLRHRRQLRHRPIRLGRRRIPAVQPDPDLSHRTPRATSARSAAPRSTPRSKQTVGELDPAKARDTGQRARQDDLCRGGVQPSADPVARKRRRAKQSGELRRRSAWPTRTTPRSAS